MSLFPLHHATDRFFLRPYAAGDGAQLHDAVSSSQDHLSDFPGLIVDTETAERAEHKAREMGGRFLFGEAPLLTIRSPDGTRQLGGTGFHPQRSMKTGVAEVGMWLREECAGHGLGTSVLGAMLKWGLSEWPFRRLVWRCDVANTASRRVAEKNGMTLEGIEKQGIRHHSGELLDVCVYASVRL